MIILLVPEIEALLLEADAVPGTFSKLMARAQRRELDPTAYLCELVTDHPVAPAPIARRHERPDDAAGQWAFADPVNLRPDLRAVWIQPDRFDPIDQPAVTELSELVADVGMRFELTRPERAFLALESSPLVDFTPPWNFQGRSMEHVLPGGEDAARWIRLLNDCQVILHQHSGDEAITPSGLWIWGAGRLPEQRPPARVSHLIGIEDGLQELAAWLDLSWTPEESGIPDSSLRVFSIEAYQEPGHALSAIEELIRPIWRRLLLGSIDAFELASRRSVYRITPRDAWRFWKRLNR